MSWGEWRRDAHLGVCIRVEGRAWAGQEIFMREYNGNVKVLEVLRDSRTSRFTYVRIDRCVPDRYSGTVTRLT